MIASSLFLSLLSCEKGKSREIISEKEGVTYYQKGEYEKALPLLRKAADSDNAAAFYYLGLMQREGKGTEKNYGKSCENFRKAAEGGYQNAYLLTGICYRIGDGVKRDDTEAFRWAKKAADTVDQSRMNNEDKLVLSLFMADRYFAGEGTLQDFSEAAKWYEKAARLGDPRAQGVMAFFTFSGKGVVKDREKTKYWAEKAASQGDSMGEAFLGALFHYRENPDMKKAILWYEKSAMKNNEVAQYQLGRIYENGTGVKKDLTKAHHYYRLAAKSGKESMIKALADFEARHKLKKTD